MEATCYYCIRPHGVSDALNLFARLAWSVRREVTRYLGLNQTLKCALNENVADGMIDPCGI